MPTLEGLRELYCPICKTFIGEGTMDRVTDRYRGRCPEHGWFWFRYEIVAEPLKTPREYIKTPLDKKPILSDI